MAQNPALAVQKALIGRLRGLDTEAGARAYDTPPLGAAFPYITIGPVQVVPEFIGCGDASDVIVQVDVWSQDVGFPQVMRISGVIYSALNDKEIVLEDHVCDLIEVRSVEYMREIENSISRADGYPLRDRSSAVRAP